MNISYTAFALFASACLTLSPTARAVSPPPDGGYPNRNTAEGDDALFSLTTGFANTAIGFDALFSNTTGSFNTANGFDALVSNTTGNNNTANGGAALFNNTTGGNNTANGVSALVRNTTGSENTAVGASALANNTESFANTAVGFEAALNTTVADGNTALGWHALYTNSSGFNNVAIGHDALALNTGHANTALGTGAGANLTDGVNNIDIGHEVFGVAGESGTIRIGLQGTQTATFIAGILGTPIRSGMPVSINASGQLGVRPSAARFKEAIKPMDKASEAILALKPVTFHYKKELDRDGVPEFGLVAEDVAKVNPDLVVRDAEGKIYTVRYDAVNAMLLNEFLKAHRKVQAQDSTIREQQATIAELKRGFQDVVAHLREQDSKIEKVSAELALTKAAPRTLANR